PSPPHISTLSLHDALPILTGGPPTNPATVFFSWSNSAFADGRVIPVTYSNVTNPNSYELYLAYPMSTGRADVKLVHDPVLGVDRDRKSTRLNSSHVSISYA